MAIIYDSDPESITDLAIFCNTLNQYNIIVKPDYNDYGPSCCLNKQYDPRILMNQLNEFKEQFGFIPEHFIHSTKHLID